MEHVLHVYRTCSDMPQMQYCHRVAYPPNSGRMSIFGNAKGMRWSYQCSGVRCCEQIHDKLASSFFDHTQLTEEQLSEMYDISRKCNTNTDNMAQQKAKAFVISLLQDEQNGKLCNVADQTKCDLALLGQTEVVCPRPCVLVLDPLLTRSDDHYRRPSS